MATIQGIAIDAASFYAISSALSLHGFVINLGQRSCASFDTYIDCTLKIIERFNATKPIVIGADKHEYMGRCILVIFITERNRERERERMIK